jgi:hypothetical protein
MERGFSACWHVVVDTRNQQEEEGLSYLVRRTFFVCYEINLEPYTHGKKEIVDGVESDDIKSQRNC